MGTKFTTDAEYGKRYKDKASGFEGECTAIYFYQHGCERVNLRGINGQGEVLEYAFDAPDLEEVSGGKKAEPLRKLAKTGGPGGGAATRRSTPSRR